MKKYFSLTTRITCFATIIVLLVGVLVAYAVFTAAERLSLRSAKNNIEMESHLIANNIGNALDNTSGDLLVIANTPPIQGIIRSIKNGGKDALDKSSLPAWRARLETIFSSMLESNKNYTQVRYIGLASNGKEIVRVERDNTGIHKIPPVALQEKSARSYFKRGAKLAKGSILFTDIGYNVERGKIQEPPQLTWRVITPVYTSAQKIFGLLVINFNVLRYLQDVLIRSKLRYNVILVRGKSLFLFDHKTKKISFFKPGQIVNEKLPGFKSIIYGKDIVSYLKKYQDRLTVVSPVYTDVYGENKVIDTIISLPKSTLISADYNFLAYVMLWVAGSGLLAAFLIFIFSHQSLRPLAKMAKEIDDAPMLSTENIELPTHLNNEVGLLAKVIDKKTKLLNKLALYDGLTGLPNRKSFLDELEGLIQAARAEGGYVAVGFIDINKFKLVNDTYGHDYGDDLLVQFSDKLKKWVGASSYVARLGGDEFGFVIPAGKQLSPVFQMIKNLETELNGAYLVKGISIHVLISGGLSVCPRDGFKADVLLRNADGLMYQSKNNNDGKFIYLDGE